MPLRALPDRLASPLLAAAAAFLSITFVTPAGATVVETTATSYAGPEVAMTLRADDAAVPGSLVITLTVAGPGATLADLRGFFLHVADESLVSGLSVVGDAVTGSLFLANGVSRVENGKYFNAIKQPCPCDLGVELGTPGIRTDDLQTVTFTLSHATAALDVSLLIDQQFGAFLGNVGPAGDREHGSKVIGLIPVPEPGPALLLGLGLAGIASVRSRPVARS
jgi:hypothetical protein